MSQFCIDCGAELKPNVKFCTKCGATTHANSASSIQTIETAAEHTSSSFTRYLPHAFGGIFALGLAAVGFNYFFGTPIKEVGNCDPASAAAGAECAAGTAAEPAITGQQAQLFIVADANVRDRATSKGSNILNKLMRGTQVSGVMQIGEDSTSQWFKLDDGAGYVGAVNLATVEPPELAMTFTDMKWNVEVSTDLLAAPTEGSAVVAHLNMRDQVTLAGVTENGYVETKRTKGGVGYFLATAANDRTGALMLEGGYAGSATASGKQSTVAVQEQLAVDRLLRGANNLIYSGTIGDQSVTFTINTDDKRNLLFTFADYQILQTGRLCSSMLVFSGLRFDSWIEFTQGITKNGEICTQPPPDVHLFVKDNTANGPSQTIAARWVLNGKVIMNGELVEVNPN